MKGYRIGTVGLVLAVFFIAAISLSGCGKAPAPGEKPDVKKSAETAAKAAPEAAAEKKEVPAPSTAPITEERTYYDFETDLNGWEIPMWAQGKTDHVAKDVMLSKELASHGNGSMLVVSDFPGGAWSASLVEIQQYLDLSKYRVIRADLYLPADAPLGLKAKLILTVGENWKFVEMSRSVPLVPGEWVTVEASIEPGSYDWKRVVPDEEFSEDIRKVALRIESNRKPVYSGPIYIDNIRCGR